MAKRECGTCTKCCEGWLIGEALGHTFYQGKPCHFVSIGAGCTTYATRPAHPCASYKCEWLSNLDIPEWMKPNQVDAILSKRNEDGIPYISLNEAGSVVSSRVLSWLLTYCLVNKINVYWEVESGTNWLGTSEFVEKMNIKYKKSN
jgi:hypothetical protein